ETALDTGSPRTATRASAARGSGFPCVSVLAAGSADARGWGEPAYTRRPDTSLSGKLVQKAVRVGSWLVDASLNNVSSEGRTIRLEPKVMGVLLCLAEHPGETLSKEQLFQAVWPNTVVTEDVLKRCIAE